MENVHRRHAIAFHVRPVLLKDSGGRTDGGIFYRPAPRQRRRPVGAGTVSSKRDVFCDRTPAVVTFIVFVSLLSSREQLSAAPAGRRSGPNQQPGRILVPGDGAAGDQGLRIGLPARQWRLRDACGLSRLNDFLALWSQAHVPSGNRQVTSTSIHMAKPVPASVPRGHAPL
jgi:hypothetical protein